MNSEKFKVDYAINLYRKLRWSGLNINDAYTEIRRHFN